MRGTMWWRSALAGVVMIGLGAGSAAAQPGPGSTWDGLRWDEDPAQADPYGADDPADDLDWSDDAVDAPPTRVPDAARAPSRPAEDLRLLEAEVLDEMNRMRRDPVGYAAKLRRLRPYFEGAVLRVPGKPAVMTQEGLSAVDEAIAVLERTGARPQLTWSDGLAAAARDHATDLGRSGLLGHAGSDGSHPDDRASRHGRWRKVVAENITFGSMTAEEVVVDLLVDDGVADRGHRDVLLDRALHVAGVSCGPHPSYRLTCVIDYAGAFEDAPGTPRALVDATPAPAPTTDFSPFDPPRVEIRPVQPREVPSAPRAVPAPTPVPQEEPIIEV
ncbi:MAG: hypothetical protein EP329_05395 [Deltaproteobacteria bacterium]|nr:MAG: hypothetical protein EP329_05395 [Deltaproteobacteria bacterium]